MRSIIITGALVFLLAACAGRETPAPETEAPGCADTQRQWEYQHDEILHLNRGFAYHQIIERQAFVETFNAMDPVTDRPVPETVGYFSKPGEDQAILVFVSAGCVTYLEIVSDTMLQAILPKTQPPAGP